MVKHFNIKPEEAKEVDRGLFSEILDEVSKNLKPIYPNINSFLRSAMLQDMTYDIGVYYNGAKVPVGVFIINKLKSKLNLFFIHPDYRDFCYGREMFNVMVQEMPYQRFHFTIPDTEDKLENFYLKMGCKKEGELFDSEDCNYKQQKFTFE